MTTSSGSKRSSALSIRRRTSDLSPSSLALRRGRYPRNFARADSFAGGGCRSPACLRPASRYCSARRCPSCSIWGLYLLPLQYLRWIGLALLALSLASWICSVSLRGPLIYVEEGVPLVARIAALFLRTKLVVEGTPSVYEYVAVLEHRDPSTDKMTFTTATHEISAASRTA